MLQLQRISDFDLAAFLDIHFGDRNQTPEQSREELEYEILSIWDKDCDAEDMTDEERNKEENKPTISPYWLHRVLVERTHKQLDDLSVEDHLDYLARSVSEIWRYRAANADAIAARTMPSLPPPLTLPARRRGAAARKPRT